MRMCFCDNYGSCASQTMLEGSVGRADQIKRLKHCCSHLRKHFLKLLGNVLMEPKLSPTLSCFVVDKTVPEYGYSTVLDGLNHEHVDQKRQGPDRYC